jgi:hypothetical protein
MAAPLHPRGNIPSTPLRWSLDAASFEFAMSATTLRKLLNQASVAPGEDGCYSTTQLLSGVYGRMHEERLKTQQQLTRKYELANKATEASLLDRAALSAALAQVADAIKARVMSSALSREIKEDILREIASVPVALADVASRQTKLPRGNGQAVEDGEGEDAA